MRQLSLLGRWGDVLSFRNSFLLFAFLSFFHIQNSRAEDAKCYNAEWSGLKSIQADYVRTVDGDTIKVRVEGLQYSVRMLNIDTPETHYQGKSQGYWGEQATARLKEILAGSKKVRILFGLQHCDHYGRILGFVFDGKRDVNLQMAEEGFAANYCIAPNLARCQIFADAVARAREAGLGIFSNDPPVEIAYEWRRRVSGRPYEKWVGDMRTQAVYTPGSDSKIPVEDRVYFMRKSDVKTPYRVAR